MRIKDQSVQIELTKWYDRLQLSDLIQVERCRSEKRLSHARLEL
jgi:hypothetical protein